MYLECKDIVGSCAYDCRQTNSTDVDYCEFIYRLSEHEAWNFRKDFTARVHLEFTSQLTSAFNFDDLSSNPSGFQSAGTFDVNQL